MQSALNFDPWIFAGRHTRPVSAATCISWQDFGSMNIHNRKVRERRLPVPAWALNDVLLRALLVAYVETRAHVHKTDGTLLERWNDAEKCLKNRIPAWNKTIDRLQLQYVAAQHDGSPKKRLDDLEQEIEALDTLIRVTQKGTTGFLAAIVVLYYRMGKTSVDVAAEIGAKPPLVRQILYRMHRVWQDKFQLEFMLEPAEEKVLECRTYRRAEINSMLAAGKIVIPADKPGWVPPPAQACDSLPSAPRKILAIGKRGPRLLATRELGPAIPASCKVPTIPGESRKERRARRMAAGLCGNCGNYERGDHTECPVCRAYYNQKSLEYQRNRAARSASRPATVENSNQKQVTENFERAQFATCDA